MAVQQGSAGANGVAAPLANNTKAPAAPAFTAAQAAQAAWISQAVSKPSVSMQPVGNKTFPNLAVYFQATHPGAGLTPSGSAQHTLLGHTITLRAASVRYTYNYGDGTNSGATTDAGGPYPTGNIRHTYTKSGKYATSISMTMTAEFREGNGTWTTIPGSVTVTGPTTTLTVVPLQSRLVK